MGGESQSTVINCSYEVHAGRAVHPRLPYLIYSRLREERQTRDPVSSPRDLTINVEPRAAVLRTWSEPTLVELIN